MSCFFMCKQMREKNVKFELICLNLWHKIEIRHEKFAS